LQVSVKVSNLKVYAVNSSGTGVADDWTRISIGSSKEACLTGIAILSICNFGFGNVPSFLSSFFSSFFGSTFSGLVFSSLSLLTLSSYDLTLGTTSGVFLS